MKIFLIILAVIFYFIFGYVLTNVLAAIYDMDLEDFFDGEGPLGLVIIFFWPIAFLILLIIFIGQKISVPAIAITMFLINKKEKDESESNTWIITDIGNIKCPNCGGEPYFGEDKKYNFCPFCGIHINYVKEDT